MLTAIHPKLPMRNLSITKAFYIDKLQFEGVGPLDFSSYLMLKRDDIEIHFFEYRDLDPLQNDGQVYIRTNNIHQLHQSFLERGIEIHPNGGLQAKPWGQIEFSILDPDHNLLTFGQSKHTMHP